MSKRVPSKTSVKGAPTKKKEAAATSQPKKEVAGTSQLKKEAASTSRPKKVWELPALSIPAKPITKESELEKLRKKTIRRHAPPGEDLKCMKLILKSIKGQKMSVQEFIALVAPSTGDKGEVLRTVMDEDLNAFRKLAKKVCETVTQDNSDVMLNQQLQLSEYYKEKKTLLQTRMMNAIEEIYMMAPKFDLDRYAANREQYLAKLFPVPPELVIEPEEIEAMKRQAAFHRLQWLRSEGERLNDENNSLKTRLKQLKRFHMDEQVRMAQMEQDAEAKKEALEATQAEKTQTLETLSESLEKSIIEQEKSIRQNKDKVLLQPGRSKTQLKKKKGLIRRRPKWNEDAAKDIDLQTLHDQHASDSTKVSSSFHFSPIKSPPPAAPRPDSPFHYSPVRSPPPATARPASPFHYSPPKSPRVVAQPAPQQVRAPSPPPPQVPRGRRGAAPRDSWGGFY